MINNADLQQRYDIDECVNAYCSGGKKLATITFQAICNARALKRFESIILGELIRKQIAVLETTKSG